LKRYEGKTKEQLVNELEDMRQRVAVLEKTEVEHKQAEVILSVEEDNYQKLFGLMPIGITVHTEWACSHARIR
jgi:hypothetical protein